MKALQEWQAWMARRAWLMWSYLEEVVPLMTMWEPGS